MYMHFWDDIHQLINEVENDSSDNNTWNAIYHNDVKPLSRLEKESKYSSKLLPTGELPKPTNSYDLDSAPGMKTNNWQMKSIYNINIVRCL